MQILEFLVWMDRQLGTARYYDYGYGYDYDYGRLWHYAVL